MNRLALIAMLVLADCCFAQVANPTIPDAALKGLTRRESDTPGLVIETTARTGALDVLIFVDGGKVVLTAGDDKVVRAWDVTEQGLKPSRDWPTLRWPVFREARGNIYTMALHPKNKSVLVAGNDQTASGFGAAIIDRETGNLLAATPRATSGLTGSVWASTFSPSGKRAALGTESGGVWVWEIEAGTIKQVAIHRQGARGDPQLDFVRFLGFDGENSLISIGGNGDILQIDLIAGTSQTLVKSGEPIATPIVRSADGSTVAWVPESESTDRSNLCVAPFPAMSPIRKIRLDVGSGAKEGIAGIPHRVGLSADGKVAAVAVRDTDDFNHPSRKDIQFYRELGGHIITVDLSNNSPIWVPGPTQSLYAEGIAFHPTKPTMIAVAGGDDHELALHDLASGQPIGPAVTTSGVHGLWNCTTSADGRYVAFQPERDPLPMHPNRRGMGPWRVFDLQELQVANEKSFDAESVSKEAADGKNGDGWRVVTRLAGKADNSQWYLVAPGTTTEIRLEWNRAMDEFPRCFTFVPKDPTKGRQTTQLLVGHYWGFSAFDCVIGTDQEDKPLIRRTRTFRGHEGYVTGISISADCTRVVTSSRDLTICGWSLGTWQHHPKLGAEFLERDGKLIAGKIAPGSPIWEMGVSTGDEILAVASVDPVDRHKLKVVYSTGDDWGAEKKGKTGDIVTADFPVGGTTYLTWKSSAGPVRQLTSLVERPLWRFFPQGDDWVMWRWRDFFYASSTNGDGRIGWQKSFRLEEKRTPVFYRAEQFRSEFQRPDKLREMLNDWRDDGTALHRFAAFEPPIVAMETPTQVAADGEITVKITLSPRGVTANQAPEQLLFWVNDCLYKNLPADATLPAPERIGGAISVEVRVPATMLRGGANVLFAQVYSHAGIRGDSRPIAVTCARQPAKPKLYGRFFGVGDYSASRLPNLRSNGDAGVLVKAWQSQKGKAFEEIDAVAVVDRAATPARILEEIRALAKAARPEDIVILSLGGHGARRKQFQDRLDHKKLPQQSLAGMGNFAYLTGNFDLKRVAETTLDFERIQEAFSRVNAHKLILLDTCHSGEATATAVDPEANPLRVLGKHGVGCAILSACQSGEEAQEDASTVLDVDGQAAGLFTIALRRMIACEKSAFNPADVNHDGKLDVEEFAAGVAEHVGWIVKVEAPGAGLEGVKHQKPDRYVPEASQRVRLVVK